VQRRRFAALQDVEASLLALDLAPHQISASSWPGDLVGLDSPGLYSWWVDSQGAADLSQGIGERVSAGRIYAGQTGATKWPSGRIGSMTLRKRLGGNHIRGGVRSSTFRLTLAAALCERLELNVIAPKRLDGGSERLVSEWIARHLALATHAYHDPDPLGDLEDRVLAVLNPPLNIDRMPPSPVRTRLSELRALIAHGVGCRGH
jgi:GIY-YIG catalytic domain-containing protein